MSILPILPPVDRYRIVLALAADTDFPAQHGGILRGLISRALGDHELPYGLVPFACERRRSYRAGDRYAFVVTLVGEARAEIETLVDGLVRLGGRPAPDPRPMLGGNFVVAEVEPLARFHLEAERSALAQAVPITVELRSPLRLEAGTPGAPGEQQLPRDWRFAPDLFLDRIWRRLFRYQHRTYPERADRDRMPALPPDLALRDQRLTWRHLAVHGTRRKARNYGFGGIYGSLTLTGLDATWLDLLTAGMAVHVGKHIFYGLGRYTLAGTPESRNPAFLPARRAA